MKRLAVLTVIALLAGLVSGCRFAVVEDDAIRVLSRAALAEGDYLFEDEGATLFDYGEPDLTAMESMDEKLAEAAANYVQKMEEAEEEAFKDRVEDEAAAKAASDAAKAAAKAAALAKDKRLIEKARQEEQEGEPTGAQTVRTPLFVNDRNDDVVIGLRSRDEYGEGSVRRLQEALAERGYLKIEPDGEFGSRTLKALKRYQHENGLPQTGVLDAQTKALLYPAPAVTTAPEDVRHGQGSSGDEVVMVQRRLRQYGFSTRQITGELDDRTAEVITAFQEYAVEKYGTEFDDPVVPTGLPAEPALIESRGTFSEPVAAPTPGPEQTSLPVMPALAPAATLRPHHAVDGVVSDNLYTYLAEDRFPVYRQTVQRGDEGEEVLRVQNRLVTLDLYYEAPEGSYDKETIDAVKAFQAANGLQQTGIADEETQRRLFSDEAVGAEQVDKPFYIKVSLDEQRVYIYRWANGSYSQLVKTLICSSGLGNTTPRGVFVSPGHRDARWHYFGEFHCWAQYAFIIRGNILFHSVIFSRRDANSLRRSTLYNLGRKASHGCVRLKVEDAKWIYDHCGPGQVIEIY